MYHFDAQRITGAADARMNYPFPLLTYQDLVPGIHQSLVE